MHQLPLTVGVYLVLAAAAQAGEASLNTRLMLATCKVASGPATGTGFVLVRPAPGADGSVQHLLVTAGHLFDGLAGDDLTVFFRRQTGEGEYARLAHAVPARRGGQPLWVRHAAADVAVLPIDPPAEAVVPRLSIDLLAADARLQEIEFEPGDRVLAIGYPHGNQFEANAAGFGVARSGTVASFPLLPARKNPTFLVAMNCFEGDSGAAVYLCQSGRFYGGQVQPGRVEAIVGLVSGQHLLNEEYRLVYGTGTTRHRLGLAIVVPAAVVRETIDRVPLPAAAARP